MSPKTKKTRIQLDNRMRHSTSKNVKSFSTLYPDFTDLSLFSAILKTGYENFDKKFGGFTSGEFVVIGGRPSMGKTQILLALCKNISESIPTLYFTFDHTEIILTTRFISSLSNIPINKILQNDLEPEEIKRVEYYQKYSSKYNLFISEESNSIDDFKEQCLRQIKENGIKIIIVDYLQKMTANKGDNKSPLAIITSELKEFAKANNVVLIAASQLNRSLEIRGGDKRPQLNDLKGSDSIEEDADKVIFMYRPEYYCITTDENGNYTKGVVELIMAKNKNGKLGTIKLLRDINFRVPS